MSTFVSLAGTRKGGKSVFVNFIQRLGVLEGRNKRKRGVSIMVKSTSSDLTDP